MSVLINGMKIPTSCFSCDFCNPFADEPYCRRLMRRIPKDTRLEDCPIVEIPAPHGKYEYHYDHTDCIWYRTGAQSGCPSTCAQYRDGWNDAMNYIFRDGEGYRPYKRGAEEGETDVNTD